MRLKLNHNGVQVVVKWAHDMDLGPAHAVLIFVPGVSLHVGAVGEGHVEGQTREDADVVMQAGELEGSVASVVGSDCSSPTAESTSVEVDERVEPLLSPSLCAA